MNEVLADPAHGRVYIAGNFSQVTNPETGESIPVTNVAAFVPSTGAFDTTWKPSVDGAVNALALSPNGARLYLGGDFSTVGGQVHKRLARVSTTTGAPTAAWQPVANRTVKALATAGNWLYVGGQFTTLNEQRSPHLARLSSSTGDLDQSWTPQPDAQVLSLVPTIDRVYVGGTFSNISGNLGARSIASLDLKDGTPTPKFKAAATNLGSRSPAYDLYLDGSHLLAAVGGAGGACASLNATGGQLEWSKHTNGNGQAVTALAGVAYCGGHFGGADAFDGLVRYKLAAVVEGTGQVTDFAPRLNSPLGVWALAVDASHLYAGGDFTTVDGQSRPHFAVFE